MWTAKAFDASHNMIRTAANTLPNHIYSMHLQLDNQLKPFWQPDRRQRSITMKHRKHGRFSQHLSLSQLFHLSLNNQRNPPPPPPPLPSTNFTLRVYICMTDLRKAHFEI